jgi:Pyruvate/2-oxoacid:ferredoxin oxidoreductase gamma subunit
MNSSKQRLLNIIVASSIAINLVMLGALAYIATIDSEIARLDSAMRAPVFVVVSKNFDGSAVPSQSN